MNDIYYQRRNLKPPFKIYCISQFVSDSGSKLFCKIRGVPADGRLACSALIQQRGGSYGGYKKLSFEFGESISLVSASLSNPYLLFVYRETSRTLKRLEEAVEIYAVESTCLEPRFEAFPPGFRSYSVSQWDDFGNAASHHLLHKKKTMQKNDTDKSFKEGTAPVSGNIFLARLEFNPENLESLVSKEKIKFLSCEAGDLIVATINPNSFGWFEGYNGSDPKRLCGVIHVDATKKLNFK